MITLNINKLRTEVEERETKKNKLFENILELCYQKILNNNKKYNDYMCTFIVPNVVFGLPLYNLGDCVTFIMDRLIQKGFEIYFAPPTTIHISWKPKNQQNHDNLYLSNNTNTNINNSNNQLDYYNTLHNQNKLMIKYTGSSSTSNQNKYNENDNNNTIRSIKHNNVQNKKYQEKNINYKPIDDYKQMSNTIYDLDDLELFQNKIDNLF